MKEVLLVEGNPTDVYLIRAALVACDPDIHLSLVISFAPLGC